MSKQETNPTDKILEEIEQDKKKIKKSAILALAALIAIIALCIAWFVANTRVTGTSASVSADDDTPFLLASTGSRQNAENTYLKDDDGNNLLSAGAEKTYSSYVDTKTGDTIETGEKEYYTGVSSLAWYLNGQESLMPGASGKLEFYIIPTKNAVQKTQVEVTIDLEAYQLNDKKKAVRSTDESLQGLVNGHILLFQDLDSTQGYSGWLYQNGVNKLTVNAPNGGFQKDTPYKITVYWVWPKYFRNYVYNSRNVYGDLFADTTDNNKDYTALKNYVKEQKENVFGTSGSDITSSITWTIDNTMSDDQLDSCSKYYNEADEYIGKQQCYVHIEASVQ